MSQPNSIPSGSEDLPEVLHTLAGVLHQFTGPDLESQLQTYDTFLEILAPSARPQIARLLNNAAIETQDPISRKRIEDAVQSISCGGRAANPYNHDQAMTDYQKAHRESFPNAAPAPIESIPIPLSPIVQTEPKPLLLSHEGKRLHPEILAQLDQIEAELKRIGRWSGNPAEFEAAIARGEINSYLDAPTFELWLQCILIPRARQGVQDDQLPSSSSVGEMARRQYDYMSIDYEAENLLSLLQRFDTLIIQAAR